MPTSYLPLSTQDVDMHRKRSSQSSRSPLQAGSVAHMATTTLKVEGMTCGACTSAVESGFQDVDGVGHVSVSLVMERAVVQHDPLRISPDAIKEIIEDRGFDAEVLSSDVPLPDIMEEGGSSSDDELTSPKSSQLHATTLSVGGMTCGACTSAVEGGFKDVPGVKSFSISLLSERAVIEHDPSILTAERIAEIIEDTGFDASVIDTKPATQKSRTTRRRRRSFKKFKTTTTTISVEGMTCGACTSAVESGFKGVEGVIRFNISLLAERAVVVHDATKITAEKIVEIIEDRGFDAHVISSQDSDNDATRSGSTVQLKIFGLQTSDSATSLETKLRSLPGIDTASINFATRRATITHQPSAIGLRATVDAIEGAGFNALVAESDDNNAQLESLAKTKEIQEWRRSFQISLSFAIPVFLTSMIFPMLLPFLDYGGIKLPFIPGLWLGDVVCLLLTIPVQFGIGRRFYKSAFKSLRHGSPTMDVLVVLGTSAAFFFSVAGMVISIVAPPHSRPATVFDTSTMLITFISLGRLLENSAKSQTSKALSRLMSLAPSMATIYSDPIAAERLAEEDDISPRTVATPMSEKTRKPSELRGSVVEEKHVPTELLQVGDVVVLRPGDKIPADGFVLRGQSFSDESMVTGEAMPIVKKRGSVLMAGTVNGAGRLDFKVTRAGRDTQLSQIVRLVQEAQTTRAPIQLQADKVAGYFVPVIIALGATTFIAWMILSHALPNPPQVFLDHASGGRFMVCLKLCISVIVFACPCALGLSTPTAVMVGTGVGAEHGILVKGGEALETATKVTHVIFDKTGTLTSGKMEVSKVDWDIPSDANAASWIRLWWTAVGLAENSSEHPIGKAIVRAAKERLHLPADGSLEGSVDYFEAVIGQGISASVSTIQGNTPQSNYILIGNAAFLHSKNITIPSSDQTSSSTKTPPSSSAITIHIAFNNHYTGTIHLSDTIKPMAVHAITALSHMGIPSSIVTGDALSTALSVAATVGIPASRVHASCSPDRKQEIILEMQAAGECVAMVGDGINDSPALVKANVGISLASGTDVAMEAADVVLMRPDQLMDVPAALHLARTIFKRIRMNLLWACGYNIIGLPFAMGFFLPLGISLHPMAAGAAMACSSVSVVLSSLALRWWQRPRWMDAEVLKREGAGSRAMRPRRKLRERVSRAVDVVIGETFGAKRKGSASGRGEYVALEDVEAGG